MQEYELFFDRICANRIPPQVPFNIPERPRTFVWPQDKIRIQEIRNSPNERCGEFILDMYGFQFIVTAGVKRNHDFSLYSPNKKFPYEYPKNSFKPLNYLLCVNNSEMTLDENGIPRFQNARTYNYLIRGFVESDDIKNLAINILKILKCKEENDLIDSNQFSSQNLYRNTLEIAAIIITCEYFRGKQSLSIAYTEFYKLKHNPTVENLNLMFKRESASLIFPSEGGSKQIMETGKEVLIASFESMLSVKINDHPSKGLFAYYNNFPEAIQKYLQKVFFISKLQKLRYIYQ